MTENTPQGWRDMASAPKDGTCILTYPHYIVTHWVEASETISGQSGWAADLECDGFSTLSTRPEKWHPLPHPHTGFADSLVVSEEMLDAGASVYADWCSGFGGPTPRDLVDGIFQLLPAAKTEAQVREEVLEELARDQIEVDPETDARGAILALIDQARPVSVTGKALELSDKVLEDLGTMEGFDEDHPEPDRVHREWFNAALAASIAEVSHPDIGFADSLVVNRELKVKLTTILSEFVHAIDRGMRAAPALDMTRGKILEAVGVAKTVEQVRESVIAELAQKADAERLHKTRKVDWHGLEVMEDGHATVADWLRSQKGQTND